MIASIDKLQRIRLVVDIDTQSHFFLNNSKVCVQNHRQVLTNILRVIHWANLQNIHMISTVQTLGQYRNFMIGGRDGQEKIRHTLCRRCIRYDASDCTDLIPGIFEKYEQVIFCKRCFDPFVEPRADRMLSEFEADEFVLIGAATEGAVRATALGLLARHKKVTVLVDATGSYDKKIGETTLRLLRERGAKLVKTARFLASSGLGRWVG
ncbi:MAG: cysteine hydrolase family protein [Planctomycetota bacterium]|jgi:nicotinamidase-related amidase